MLAGNTTMADETEDDTRERIQCLRTATAERLRLACGDRGAIVAAIEQFLDEGMPIVYSPSALWDYFATSSPSVPKLAGYDATGIDRITRIFSTVTWERWGEGQPLPPDWPWHEQPEA